MGISVLGPLVVDDGKAALGPRDRVVLAALAVRPGEAVPGEQLADALWGDTPPASWSKVVQGCVVRLRKHLGSEAIETAPSGYRLRVSADELDSARFQRLVERSRELTAFGEPERAMYVLGEALALWRDRPLPELDRWAPGRIEADRLEELRMDVQEAHVEAALAAGRHRQVLADAQARVAERPLREHRWALLARAQYQCGRQGDALRTIHRARQVVSEELGVDPGPELVVLEQALLRQDPSLAAVDAGPDPGSTCPYPGLVAYDVDDAEGFFGRDADVASCLQRLASVGTVTVVGPSGCGKSSLVRAGVGAALKRDGRRLVVITPGAEPMDALRTLPSAGPAPVLIVDQCEEVFTASSDPAEQARFFAALAAHAARGRLVVAVRADHVGGLAVDPAFARLVERSVHLLGAMDEAQLRAAIEGPARQAGVLLEPGLVDLLVREVEGEPGALPLLSHALHQTWQRREGRTLTVAGYRSTGGIQEAVGRSAELIYDQTPVDQRAVLKDLLLRLVTPVPEGDPVRSRIPRKLLDEDDAQGELVERLVDARLLTSDDGVIELAHEALVRAWPRMREWLDDDVEGQRILRHLSAAAAAWDAMGRPDSELYRGARLATSSEWADDMQPSLTSLERSFLERSLEVEAADLRRAETQLRKERRTVGRLRILAGSVAVLALVAMTASAVAVNQQGRADERARIADARRLGARALVEHPYDRALLLGVESVNVWDSPETQGNLVTAIERNPAIAGVIRSDGPRFLEIELSPDGSRLAAADNTDDVTVYDVGTRRAVAELSASETSYRVPTFSPDGDLAVSTFSTECWEGPCPSFAVEVYEGDDLTDPTAYQGLGLPAVGLAFSPDGSLLAAAPPFEFAPASDNIAIWQVGRPDEPLRRLSLTDPGVAFHSTPDGTPTGWVAFSPDGTTLYASGHGPVTAFDVATGEVTATFDGRGGLALSPDGRTIALATTATSLGLFDIRTGSIVTELAGRSAVMTGATAYGPGADELTTAHGDGSVTVWDTATGNPRHVLEGHAGSVAGVTFGGADGHLFTAGADRSILMWDLDDSHGLAHQIAPPTRSGSIGAVLVAPGGAGAAILAEGLHLVDPERGRLIDVPVRTPPAWAAYLPDGRHLVTVEDTGALRVVDVATGEVTAESPGAGGSNRGAVAAFPDRPTIVVADAGGVVTELDATSLEPTGRTVRTGIRAGGVRATHGSIVAVTSSEIALDQGSQVVFADLDDGRILHRIRYGSWNPRANFSPDGTLYALGGFDGRLAIIDVQDGAVRGPTDPAHNGPVTWVAFSPDNRTIASIGSDGRLVLVDPRSGDLRARIRPRQRDATSTAMAFRDDGRTLVLAYDDGSMLTYDTSPTAWIAHACAVAGRNLTRSEWRTELGDRPYRETCAQHGTPTG